MYFVLLLTIFHFVSSSEERSHIYGERDKIKHNSITLNRNSILTHNATYIEKAENMLRVPVMRKYFEEQKGKRKIKKSSKRTVQKIIKKNKNRSKKVYLHQVTNKPSVTPKKVYELAYVPDEPQIKEDATTQSNLRKKSRKWSPKAARYPLSFQKLQRRENKFKRNVDRDDLFVLKDLDEVEFVTSDKDYDVVNAHVKNYW